MASEVMDALKVDLEQDMARIARRFKPHVMLTLIARNPDVPDGDIVLSRDNLGDVVEAIVRLDRSAAPPGLLDATADRFKAAVQAHHDQRGDDRCHLDDLKLYRDVLGIEPDPYVTALPPDADMAESCRRYVRQRQAPEVHGKHPMPDCMTISQLTAEVERLQGENADLQSSVIALSP